MSEILLRFLEQAEGSEPLPDGVQAAAATAVSALVEGEVYTPSLTACTDGLYFVFRRDGARHLGALLNSRFHCLGGTTREVEIGDRTLYLVAADRSHPNLVALQARLPHLRPQPVGLRKSWGFGDRIGLATPGHVRAVHGTGIVPLFAQQSPREIQRTDRTAQDVMDDAVWGAFQAGWRDAFGADADHLKTPEHIDEYAAAGYTLYTLDPSEHVDDEADTATLSELREKLDALPWDALRTNWSALESHYAGRSWRIDEGVTLTFTEESLARAAVKYGSALAHAADLFEYLDAKMGGTPFELEVSVDETRMATTSEEHFFVARELQRLHMECVSLAPRFVGHFEKGVDYIGDVEEFERQFIAHAAIARDVGPYKLSVHSGSDKFRIYKAVARHANGLVHVKTAGTSYLEALRVVAEVEPELFREILAYSVTRFETDRATYYTSASPDKVPPPRSVPDDQLAGLLDDVDARQILHIAFGSVLAGKDEYGRYLFRDDLARLLEANEETYAQALARHLGRHLEAFVQS